MGNDGVEDKLMSDIATQWRHRKMDEWKCPHQRVHYIIVQF